MRATTISILLVAASCASVDPVPDAPALVPRHAPTGALLSPSPSPPPSVRASVPAPPDAAEEPDAPARLPEGFVAVPHPFDAASGATMAARCGSLLVENRRGDPQVYEPFVLVTHASTGKKVYEAHGRRVAYEPGTVSHMALTASACGDLTGDGVPELLLTERTMGSHCCYTHYVASLTSPSRLIMTWDKGDSGNGIWPVKLKPGKVWQVASVDIVWPPFNVEEGDPSVPYAGAPGFPIVFDLVGGEYRKRTFDFVDALRRERDEHLASCKQRRGSATEQPSGCEPYDLHDWGMALLLDEWDAKKEQVIPDAELRAVLDKRAKAMKRQLRLQLGG